MPARQYSSQAVQTSLVGNVSAGTTTIPVASVIGFPSTYPYTLVLDKGTSNEEIIEITNASGTSLTATRAIDGSTALAHSNGALVVHAVTARDLREPQDHIYATSNVHGVTGPLLGGTSPTITNATLITPTITTPSASGGTYFSPTLSLPGISSFQNALHAHGQNTEGGFVYSPRVYLTAPTAVSRAQNTLIDVSFTAMDGNSNPTSWITVPGTTFTIPYNGFYVMAFGCAWDTGTAATQRTVIIRSGGGVEIANNTSGQSQTGNVVTQSCSWVGPMSSGNTVKCTVVQNGSGAINTSGHWFGAVCIARY